MVWLVYWGVFSAWGERGKCFEVVAIEIVCGGLGFVYGIGGCLLV